MKILHPTLCAIILLPMHIFGLAHAQTSETSEARNVVSRGGVIRETQRQIRLAGGLATLSDAKKAGVAKLVGQKLSDEATELIPDLLYASSKDVMDAVLNVPLVIKYDDQEYCRVAARLHLTNVGLRIKYLEMFPLPSADDRRALESNIRTLCRDIQSCLERRNTEDELGFEPEQIKEAVLLLEKELIEGIGSNPFAPSLAKPLSADQLEELNREFDKRLDASVSVIKRIQSGGGKSDTTITDEKSNRDILHNVLQPTKRAYMHLTSAPERREFDPESLSPGYRKLANDLAQSEKMLRNAGAHASTKPSQ